MEEIGITAVSPEVSADETSRHRIKEEIDKNFFVEAGAGSGKTTMLVARMVAMVESGIPIDQICAITFTKAAAREFYQRFQNELSKQGTPNCEKALQNIDLCFMGTIDSFCKMVLSEHPAEARITSGTDIIEKQEIEKHYRQVYAGVCKGLYGKELEDYSKLFRNVVTYGEDAFQCAAKLWMGHRNMNFVFDDFSPQPLDALFDGERKELIALADFLIDKSGYKDDSTVDSKDGWESIQRARAELNESLDDNFSKLQSALDAIETMRLTPGAEKVLGSFAGYFDSILKKNGEISYFRVKESYCNELEAPIKELKYSVTMTFVKKCASLLEYSMKDIESMTFFDALYGLREMLRKDACQNGELISYINRRHRYYLIDEFQDTNPLQAEIFFYLAAEKPMPEWYDCIPRKGSLFVVGDPKQSIYRFRNADVKSFLNVKELFDKEEILPLPKNFRSRKELIEYYNKTFPTMLSGGGDQCAFEPIPALPEELPNEFQGVFEYVMHDKETNEPQRIADIIETLVDNDQYQIADKDSEGKTFLRKIHYRDFMVIKFRKEDLDDIRYELDRRGIASRVEGSVPFESNEGLIELTGLYSAIADPADQVMLYGALTGKTLGFTDGELTHFVNLGGKIRLSKQPVPEPVSDPIADEVGASIRKLYDYALLAKRMTPATLFSRIMEDFKVFQHASSENLDIAFYALELLRNGEKTGKIVTLEEGKSFLNELISGSSEIERSLMTNEERDAVRLSNLHKVKGLEAPIVILGASVVKSDKQKALGLSRFEYGFKGNSGSMGYVISMKSDKTVISTQKLEDKKEAELAAIRAEEERLEYVAATRAKSALFICRKLKAEKKGVEIIPETYLWKDLLKSELKELPINVIEKTASGEKVSASDLYRTAEEENIFAGRGEGRELLDPERPSFAENMPSAARVSSKLADQQTVLIDKSADEEKAGNPADGTGTASVQDRPDRNLPNNVAPILGTMIHRLMEMTVSTGDKLGAETMINEIIHEYLPEKHRDKEAEFKKALREVHSVIHEGGYAQGYGAPQDILKTLLQADEVYCEIPFSYRTEEDGMPVFWDGIMDVVYREGDQWHIVDYKTNMEGDHLDRKYRAQLEAYKAAFREINGVEADAVIYHIAI